MNRSLKGPLGILAIGALVIGVIAIAIPFMNASRILSTSDASRARGTITVGMDNFIGYFPLCSPEMARLMLANGIRLVCADDGANYADRFAQLRDGKINFAVGTVDTYVPQGERVNYEGTIVAVFDESKGGDAIVTNDPAIKNLTDLQQRSDVKFAYTPNSPSHHLINTVGQDFGISLFRVARDSALRIKTKDSSEALQKLLSGEAKVAVLWEPNITQALAKPGVVRLLGSELTDKVIVDILIANRDLANQNPEVVKIMLTNYFRALRYYRDNPEVLRKEAAAYAKVPESAVEQMLKGVAWANLAENANLWFGAPNSGQMPHYGLIETIEKTVKILRDVGDLPANPLPSGDARTIINSSFITSLYNEGITPESADISAMEDAANPLGADFTPLSADGWSRLREFGKLRIPAVRFQPGDSTLSIGDKEQLDMAVESLKSYPSLRIVIEGHTRSGDDEMANVALSLERAEAIARYVEVTYGVDPDRVRVQGFGSSKPLPRQPGELDRAYLGRLPRVEIHLRTEVF